MQQTSSRYLAPVLATLLLAVAGVAPVVAGGKACRDKAAKEAKEAAKEPIYSVEGDVQRPQRTGGPVPDYPAEAKEEGVEGQVVTRIVIEKDGSVSDAKVVRPLGEAFDRAALDSVRQWSFEPATLKGEPVRVHYNITINFKLDGKSGEEEPAAG